MTEAKRYNTVHAAVWRHIVRRKERVSYIYVLGDKAEAQRLANNAGGYLKFGDSYECATWDVLPDELKPFPYCRDDTEQIWLELVNPLEWRYIAEHGYDE